MDQSSVTCDAPTNISSQPSNAATLRMAVDPSNVLSLVGTITSQVALITALFYYFGWVRTHSFLGYFGVDPSIVGYSTADYVLRSIDVTFSPFIYAVFVILVLFGFHRFVIDPALTSRSRTSALPAINWLKISRIIGSKVRWAQALASWRVGPSFIRWFVRTLRACAVVCVAAVLTGVIWPEYGARLGPLLPMLLVASIILLGYIAHLRARYSDTFAMITLRRPIPSSRAYGFTLLAIGLIAGMWSISLYGDRVGQKLATDMAGHLLTSPQIVVYSTERIALNGPGITVSEIPQPGTKYHYQYTGLRFFAHSSDKYLLLPSKWRHGRDRVFVLRDNDSIRIDITAQ